MEITQYKNNNKNHAILNLLPDIIFGDCAKPPYNYQIFKYCVTYIKIFKVKQLLLHF